MKALTVLQPWAWALADGRKRLENRSWKPARSAVGTWIAIHAGAKIPDRAMIHHVAELAGVSPTRHVSEMATTRMVLAVAYLAAVYRFRGRGLELEYPPAEITKPIEPNELKWAEGPYCFFFDRVIHVPLVNVRGALNLWELPAEADGHVQRYLKEGA